MNIKLAIIIVLVFLIIYCNNKEYLKENAGNRRSDKDITNAYKEFMNALEGKFNPIMIFGTLLGYIRENKFIDGDNDVDLLIHINDKENIHKHLRSKGYRLRIVNKYFTQVYINKLPIEFYFYWLDNKGRFTQGFDGPPKRYCYSTEDIFPTKQVKFNGYNIYIPNKPEIVLEKVYGKEWYIPNIDWDPSINYKKDRNCFKELYGNQK